MSVVFKISDFSEYLFWDKDVSKFDADKHASQLIHKVVEYGQLSDWNNLLQLYGKERIKETVVNLRSLSSVTHTNSPSRIIGTLKEINGRTSI